MLRAAARQEIDVNVPFEDLPKADQKFVLYGEGGGKTDSEEDWQNGAWYGVKGYFNWLETKTYKMHVRVLLEPLPRLHALPGMRRRPFPARDP